MYIVSWGCDIFSQSSDTLKAAADIPSFSEKKIPRASGWRFTHFHPVFIKSTEASK